MKFKSHDLFLLAAVILLVVLMSMIVVYISGGSAAGYDDQAHRAEISKIYPAVDWPAYREGVREVCELGDDGLANVFRLAAADGPDRLQSLEISLRYMCPERLKSDI